MKLSGKILIFVVAIMAVAVLSVTFMVMMENAGYQEEVNRENVASGVDDLQHEIDNLSEKAKYCAELLAKTTR